MALLNRPLTEDEARKLVDAWREGWPAIPSFYDTLQAALAEPAVHVVRYSADVGVTYTPSDRFYIGCRKHLALPSDCEWIVPGTENKTSALYIQQFGRAFRKPAGVPLVLDFEGTIERKKPV